MAENVETISKKIRKMIMDLGPLGMLGLIVATFILLNLIGGDLGNSLFRGASPSALMEIETRHKEQLTALFEAIEGVTVEHINISYRTVTEQAAAIFTSHQTSQTVANSVVILYQGTITMQYDVTRAISLLLDVPFHQISLINTQEITGGNENE